MFEFIRNRRRRKLLQSPIPADWQKIVARNVAVYQLLSERQQRRLLEAARIIVAERPFVGCRGLAIHDEMKVTIAAQAALLLLGEEGYYFERVPSILVYPQAYSHRHSLGSTHPIEEDVTVLGESWQRGSIVLSWPAVLSGGRNPSDGHNLVLHEFGHHLDGLDGEMGGLPPLPTHASEQRWIEVFGREFERHCNDVAAGRDTLLDPYGATNKAEMFAVSTECFFEQPIAMRERHAELFACFREFYRVDPAEWFGGESAGGGRSLQPSNEDEVEDEDERKEEMDSQVAALPPLATADQYFTRGHDYFVAGQFDLAEADFHQAIRLDPRDQEALVFRAEARFHLGHLEAALADAERACQLDGEDQEARRIRGIARVALEQYAGGLADLERMVDSGGDDVDGLFWRGVARARLDQLQPAIRDFTRVIELDPDDAEAYHERGLAWQKLHDAPSAEADFARAKELGLST